MSLGAHSAPWSLHEGSHRLWPGPTACPNGPTAVVSTWLPPQQCCLDQALLGTVWKRRNLTHLHLFWFFSYWNKIRNEWVKTVRKWIRGRKCWSVHHKHWKMLVLIRKPPHNSKYAEVAGCFQKMLIDHHQKSLWEHTHQFWKMVFLGSKTKFSDQKKREDNWWLRCLQSTWESSPLYLSHHFASKRKPKCESPRWTF